jgi:hypothetical protein
MSGFNKINHIQPTRSSIPPLGVRPSSNGLKSHQPGHHQRTQVSSSYQMTPSKRVHHPENSTPLKRSREYEYTTPAKQSSLPNSSSLRNAPIKKRSTDSQRVQPQDESFTTRDPRVARFAEPTHVPPHHQEESFKMREERLAGTHELQAQEFIDDESVEIEMGDEDDLPANQLGLYGGAFDDGFDAPTKDDIVHVKDGKVAFERVKEETIEMGGFILPGAEKKQIHKSYNWIAGRSDGQYRVVLGYNTLFKPKSKNSIDTSTGEKDSSRWRVVRFENRYKENYPYTEFPAKYLGPLIQALEKARETHDLELKEESVV